MAQFSVTCYWNKYRLRKMNINSILTNEFKILPIFKRLRIKPKKWQTMFNFKNIEHNLIMNTSFVMNGCSVKKKDGKYICYPLSYKRLNEDKLSFIQGLNLEIIGSLDNFKSVIFNELEELIFYIYLDLVVDFLEASEKEFNDLLKKQELFFNKFYRPSVLEINKYSIYLERDKKQCACNKKIEQKLIDLFLELKIQSLELPMDYDLNKTINALKEFKQIMDSIKLPVKARKFNLKFKKLGIYKDDGFYSKETNAIIVDARKIEIFVHELGHMIYDNNIKINKKIIGRDSEDYAKNFAKYCIK
jgi:hypothetical protein